MDLLSDQRLKDAFLCFQHSFDEKKYWNNRSQYNDVLIEFFQSIDILIANQKIEAYKPIFKDKYYEDDLTPFDFAVKDALEFTNQLYGEIRANSIPDVPLSFGTSWYSKLREKESLGKSDLKSQKKVSRYRLISRSDSEGDPRSANFFSSDFDKFSEEEKALIRYERSVIWHHIPIGNILLEGEPVAYYQKFHFDIARYQLEELAKTYASQNALRSELYLRLLLDALMFADCLNYLRIDLGMRNNELIARDEMKARFQNKGWLSWLWFFIAVIIVLASFLLFENNLVGAGVLTFFLYLRVRNRRINTARIENYAQILRPYNLLEGGDERSGYIDKGVIRKAMEEVDVKHQVFTPICYKMVDSLNGG